MFKQLLVILIICSKVSQVSAHEEWIPIHQDFRSTGTYSQRHHSSDPERNFNNPWSSIGNVNPHTGRNGKYTYPSYSRSSATPNNYFFYEPTGATRQLIMPPIPTPTSGGTRIYSTRLPVMSSSPTSDATRIYSTRQSAIPSPPASASSRIYSTRQLVIPYPNAEAIHVFPLNDSGSGQTIYRQNNWEREKYEDPQGFNFNPQFIAPPGIDYDAQSLQLQSRQQLSLGNFSENQLDKNDELCLSVILTQAMAGYSSKDYGNLVSCGDWLSQPFILNANIPCWNYDTGN